MSHIVVGQKRITPGLWLRTQHRPALLIRVVPQRVSIYPDGGLFHSDQPLIKTDRTIPTSMVAARTNACFSREFIPALETPLSIFLMFAIESLST